MAAFGLPNRRRGSPRKLTTLIELQYILPVASRHCVALKPSLGRSESQSSGMDHEFRPRCRKLSMSNGAAMPHTVLSDTAW